MLLTVAIPTYNRADYVSAQLERLARQVAGRVDIEVLVSDNASNDDTPARVAEHRASFRTLTVQCNTTNVGLYGNVLRAYERASGKYVWFLSDDDELMPDAVRAVVRAIEENEPEVLTLGSRTGDAVNAMRADYSSWFADSIRAFTSVIFLSTLVLRKRAWGTAGLERKGPHLYPQVTIALKLLEQHFQFSLRPDVLVRREIGRVTGDFFRLYCIDIIVAVEDSGWPAAVAELVPAIRRTVVRDFVRLQAAERVGLFHSKRGLPWSSWRDGWRKLGASPSLRARLLLILALSRVPHRLARSLAWIFIMLKARSVAEANARCRAMLSWRSEMRAADV